ncbi:MAG: radical SAM/SPASM domain-containing protein [Pseudomonadota bacterium]
MLSDPSAFDLLARIPTRLAIEPTNICNANCIFCGYRYMDVPRGVMGLDLCRDVVDEAARLGIKEIKFTPVVGDPLVDPGFLDKVEYAASKKVFRTIYTYTNLIALHRFDISRFVRSGLTELWISIYIGDPETYKKLFGVPQYERVIANVKSLVRANEEHGNPIDIAITLRTPKPQSATESTADYRSLSAMGVPIYFMFDGYDNWGGLITERDLPAGGSFHGLAPRTAPCCQLYNGLIVQHDGNVGVCWCRDPNRLLNVGHYPTQSILEIWRGQKLDALRRDWIAGVLPELCRSCMQYTSVFDDPTCVETYITARCSHDTGPYNLLTRDGRHNIKTNA